MDNTKFLKQQARSLILDSLNMTYPAPMRTDSLNRVILGIDPTYELDLLKKDVYYLIDKGWLIFTGSELTGDSFKCQFVKLTAEGKDIADRMITDSSLEL